MKDVSRFLLLCSMVLFQMGVVSPGMAAEAGEDVPAEMDPPEVELDNSVIFTLFRAVDKQLQAGNTNEANRVFFEAMTDEKYEPFAPRMFSTLIRYLLATGQVEEAQKRFLTELRTAKERALPVSDLIYGYLLSEERRDEALEWARILVSQDLPVEMRTAATRWLLQGQLAGKDMPGVLKTVQQAIADFDGAESGDLALFAARELLSGEQPDVASVEAIQKLLEEAPQDKAGALRPVRVSLAIRLAAAKGDFDAVVTELQPLADAPIEDFPLLQALSFAYRTAKQQKNFDAVDKISSAIVLDERFASCRNTRNVSAREWVGLVLVNDPEDVISFPGRLEKLQALRFAPDVVFGIYSRYFYELLGNHDLLAASVKAAAKLRPALADKADLDMLDTYEMEAAFILEDYEKVLACLEKGVPDRDAAWHEMSKTKVRAHIALKEKKLDEAAALFRAFLELLPEDNQIDPQSGLVLSRLTLAGNNEVRIGAFYAADGQIAKAQEAYKKALAYYDEAFEKNDAGQKTADMILAQKNAAAEAAEKLSVTAP